MYYTMIQINLFSFNFFQAADAAEDASADVAADINIRQGQISSAEQIFSIFFKII